MLSHLRQVALPLGSLVRSAFPLTLSVGGHIALALVVLNLGLVPPVLIFGGGASSGGGADTIGAGSIADVEFVTEAPLDSSPQAQPELKLVSNVEQKLVEVHRTDINKVHDAVEEIVTEKPLAKKPKPVAATGRRQEIKAVPAVMKVGVSGQGASESAGNGGGMMASLGQGAFGEGGSDGVRPINMPKPPYPRRARMDGFEGRAEFEIDIGTDGRVASANLLQSSGRADCDDAARGTITNRWVFEPARSAGRPISWRERVAIVFKLQQ